MEEDGEYDEIDYEESEIGVPGERSQSKLKELMPLIDSGTIKRYS